MVMLHPGDISFRCAAQVNRQLITMAMAVMVRTGLDRLALGTIKAMNMAYRAIPIEFCIASGRTEQISAPRAVPKAHPQ